MDLSLEAKGIEREIIEKLQKANLDVDFAITYYNPDGGGIIKYALTSRDPDLKVPKEAQDIVDNYFRDLRESQPRHRHGFIPIFRL